MLEMAQFQANFKSLWLLDDIYLYINCSYIQNFKKLNLASSFGILYVKQRYFHFSLHFNIQHSMLTHGIRFVQTVLIPAKN